MAETWKVIDGHPAYEVSDCGRVRSSLRGGRILRPGVASNGYPTVALGRGNTRTLHSLVAQAFLGKAPAAQEVRHKDGNRANPRLDNLAYGTRSDNINDAVKHGTWMSPARAAHCKKLRSYRKDA